MSANHLTEPALMSKFTLSSILSLIVLFILILQVQYYDSPSWILAFPVVAYLVLVIAGSIAIGFNFYFRSLNSKNTSEKVVAITFDDGPSPEFTTGLIDILEKHGVKASFFCIGEKVKDHPGIVRVLDARGHLIGNHSYSHHRWFDLFSYARMAAEIQETNRSIEKVIGKSPRLFRPPYGVTNPTLGKALQLTGMKSIGWSVRSFDTIRKAEKVMQKLRSGTAPGKVVLFHDSLPQTLVVIPQYLEWLKQNGYKIVSLEELFNINAYANHKGPDNDRP